MSKTAITKPRVFGTPGFFYAIKLLYCFCKFGVRFAIHPITDII